MRRFLVTAGFGFAATAVFACGDGGTEQGEPRPRGGAGGQGGSGGSTVVALAGSGGGAGSGGSTVALAGSGGGGASGETSQGSDAGVDMAGAGGTTTEFTYPMGCPEPSPVGIPGQKFAIQSFNFDTSELVLKNISTTTQTITGERLGWQWCSFPSYWFIAAENVTVAPGATYKFILNLNTMGVWHLPPEGSELAVYIESGTFDEPEKMVSFVSWGNGLANAGREYVATMAGLWTLNSRVDIFPSDHGLIAIGSTKLGSGYQGVSARCLVSPPNP
jgi:hypothetical protein